MIEMYTEASLQWEECRNLQEIWELLKPKLPAKDFGNWESKMPTFEWFELVAEPELLKRPIEAPFRASLKFLFTVSEGSSEGWLVHGLVRGLKPACSGGFLCSSSYAPWLLGKHFCGREHGVIACRWLEGLFYGGNDLSQEQMDEWFKILSGEESHV